MTAWCKLFKCASGYALFKSPLSSAASVHASGDSTSLDKFNVILFFPWNFETSTALWEVALEVVSFPSPCPGKAWA